MEIKRIGSVLWPGTYLAFDAGRLSVESTPSGGDFQAADWVLESLEPYGLKRTFRIRHRLLADHYLHAETNLPVCEPIHFGANSSYWVIEPLNTYETFTIRNFWRANFYLRHEGDRVSGGAVDPTSVGAHWHIEEPSSNLLLTPVHLDALWLPQDQAVAGSLADFSRLPYFDGREDVNPNTAFISEEILAPALQPSQLYLKAGLHLHWALPDALHHGAQIDDRLHFFRAPDRWLITRTADGKEKQWVVESNYLHPPGDHEWEAAVSYPYREAAHPQPFRYLGRKLPREEWTESDPLGTHPGYLCDLTAVGYGEPTFAAFYPNCHSVFGFYDEESAGKTIQQMKGVRYEIIGWHSAGADVLNDTRFQAKVEELRDGHQATLATGSYKFEALKTALGWIVEDSENKSFPYAAVYYARLTLAADAVPDPRDRRPKAAIAIGNTATEALSAHLGMEIGGVNRYTLEEQLEALHLLPELEGQLLDTGPKFREARHAQGFNAVHGGLIATFNPAPAAGEADAQSMPNQAQVFLPADLAGHLDDLNTLYRRHHRAAAQLDSRREQLFSDWYKYLVTAYPPEDARDDFPDMDEVAFFLKEHSLRQLTALRQEVDSLWAQLDRAKTQFAAGVDASQRILVEDIRDWVALVSALGGRTTPSTEPFRSVYERIRKALAAPLLALLPTGDDPPPPLSDSEKTALIAAINALLESDPVALASGDISRQIPTEGQQLLAKGNAALTGSEKRRLGRLILETALPGTLARRPPYVVHDIPAPRFWQPTEPVVLIADSELRLTDRHGEDGRQREDGLLECHLFRQPPGPEPVSRDVAALINGIQTRLDELWAMPAAEGETGRIGFYTWREQPWHPFLMEWEVELFPLDESGSHTSLDRRYKADFMRTHYDFPEDGVDLVPSGEAAPLTRGANIYTGRSLMLDYAQPQLMERLEAYCTKRLAPLYYDATKTPEAERRNKPPLDKITAWAAANRATLSPFNQAVLDIQQHLAQNPTPPVGQVLSGFNAALLQHKQTLQLPVEDPLGFSDARELAALVRDGVGRAKLRAPQPLNDFNPLRTGALRLQRLRLVDTFGRVQTLLDDYTAQELVASAPFKELDGRTVLLPPRLVQPARFDVNWLAAGANPSGGDWRMNAHPASTPVCGWLLPNYLDNSLLVYDQGGRALGALQRRNEGIAWSSAPGREYRVLEADIANPHLHTLVRYFLTQNGKFLDDALTALESALENTLPESSAEHEAPALLVGRPMAVVRASIGLELHGLPATNQDWNLFRRTLQTHTRDTDNFTGVAFPVRVGEHSRLNDGLLGFWIEDNLAGSRETSYRGNKFYLPQTPDTPRTASIDHPDLVMHRGTAVPHIQLALDTPRQILTMLVDPRGAVHISSGILPVHTLSLPPDQFAPALRDLEMTFFSGPFLTREGGIELPLPAEPGFAWSLLTKENGAWADTHAIDPVESNATFSAPHLIREGWLKLKKEQE